MASDEFLEGREDEIMTIIERLRKEDAADLYLVLFTNVIGNHSHLFAAGDQSVLSTLEYENQPVLLPGVMSRKKDFLPPFGQKLRDL